MESSPNTLQLHGNPFRNTLDTHIGDYKAIGVDFRIFTILGFFCRIARGGSSNIWPVDMSSYR